MITLGEAARLTGLGKTTVARAIKAGRLSAARTAIGSYEIDPAELSRCYPFKATTDATEAPDATVAATGPVLWLHRTGVTPEATRATAALEAQIAGLREVGDLLRRQLDEVREGLLTSIASSEAGRPAGAGADQVRFGDQPEDGQDARPRSAADAARPRRRGDRATV